MEKNQIRVKIRDILGISVNLDSWKAGCSSKSGFWFSPLRTFWLTLYNYDLHLHFTGVWWHFRWTFNPETLQLRCHKSTQPHIPPDWPQPCSVPQPQEKGADRHQQSSSEALVSALEPLPSQSGAARLLRNIQTVLCSAEDFTMELHFFIFIFPNPHFQRLSFQRVYWIEMSPNYL